MASRTVPGLPDAGKLHPYNHRGGDDDIVVDLIRPGDLVAVTVTVRGATLDRRRTLRPTAPTRRSSPVPTPRWSSTCPSSTPTRRPPTRPPCAPARHDEPGGTRGTPSPRRTSCSRHGRRPVPPRPGQPPGLLPAGGRAHRLHHHRDPRRPALAAERAPPARRGARDPPTPLPAAERPDAHDPAVRGRPGRRALRRDPGRGRPHHPPRRSWHRRTRRDVTEGPGPARRQRPTRGPLRRGQGGDARSRHRPRGGARPGGRPARPAAGRRSSCDAEPTAARRPSTRPPSRRRSACRSPRRATGTGCTPPGPSPPPTLRATSSSGTPVSTRASEPPRRC